MFETTLPSSLQVLLVGFVPCFTRPGFDNFATLITGWIVCPARHHISRVIQAASGDSMPEKHHASFYRFLSHGSWAIDALGEVLFHLLLPWLPLQITMILDDTLCHKGGPHLFGAAMHYDAHASTYGRGTSQGRKGVFAFGHNWVVAALWLPLPWNPRRGLALPCSSVSTAPRNGLRQDSTENAPRSPPRWSNSSPAGSLTIVPSTSSPTPNTPARPSSAIFPTRSRSPDP